MCPIKYSHISHISHIRRFSIVTTEPNASVAPIHDRMPLVLGPGESSMWLGEGFATLKERGSVSLVCKPERVD